MTTIEVIEAERIRRGLNKRNWSTKLGEWFTHYSEMTLGKRPITLRLIRAAYAAGIPAEALLEGGK